MSLRLVSTTRAFRCESLFVAAYNPKRYIFTQNSKYDGENCPSYIAKNKTLIDKGIYLSASAARKGFCRDKPGEWRLYR